MSFHHIKASTAVDLRTEADVCTYLHYIGIPDLVARMLSTYIVPYLPSERSLVNLVSDPGNMLIWIDAITPKLVDHTKLVLVLRKLEELGVIVDCYEENDCSPYRVSAKISMLKLSYAQGRALSHTELDFSNSQL